MRNSNTTNDAAPQASDFPFALPIIPFNVLPQSGVEGELGQEQLEEFLKNGLGIPPIDPSWMWMLNQAMMQPPGDFNIPLPAELLQGLEMPSNLGFDEALPHQLVSPLMTNKKIGPLTVEERNLKVQKFREKRQRRNFKKKVAYACRKKVADERVRVKGRFISKKEASHQRD